MLTLLDPLRDISFSTVLLRLLLAAFCGGSIGMERAIRRSPAGLRTHLLICLGAAMTTLTSQYMFYYLGLYTDIARIGAQVVAGVGFIGTGTIIITKKREIRGLTTAAGIWACSIVGLTLGAGFYEGGILATLVILFVRFFAPKISNVFSIQSSDYIYYIEYQLSETLDTIINDIRLADIDIKSLETAKTKRENHEHSESCAIISVRFRSRSSIDHAELEEMLKKYEHVAFVKELS